MRIKNALTVISESYKEYRGDIALLAVLGMFSAILEGIGLTSLIPFFALVSGTGGIGDDIVSQIIAKVLSYSHFNFSMNWLIIFVVILFILKFVTEVIVHFVTVRIKTKYEELTARKLLCSMLDSSWKTVSKQKVGDLQNLISINIKYGKALLSRIVNIIVLATGGTVYFIVALNISTQATIITLVIAVFLLFLYTPSVYKLKGKSKKIDEYNSQVAHFVNQTIIGMKQAKILMVQKPIKDIGFDYFQNLRKLRARALFRKKIMGTFVQPISFLYVIIFFLLSYKQPDFNIAKFTVIILLIHRIFGYIKQAQSSLHSLGEAFPFLKSIHEYLKHVDGNKTVDNGKEKFVFKKSIALENVSFSYGKEHTLQNVSLELKKGSMVAIIGPSGSGKSTISDLLLRLLDPSEGRVLIDGKGASGIDLGEWRSNIGYVSQDIFLVNGTIGDNIRFYNDDITEKQMIEAAKEASIYKYIQDSPDGFETKVGERGMSLSVGQRQRVVIARVLARKPQMLILDEATSALDRKTEHEIQEVINKLQGKITVVVIAHRLTTIAKSDYVYVLEDGKILEDGTFDGFMKKKDSYLSRMGDIEY